MSRTLPHSIDAEQAVIGGLMLDANAFERISDKVSESDFYQKNHRLLFRAIGELTARGDMCDAVTMAEWLERNKLSELAGGSAYVVRLANNTPGASNIVAYAKIVRERSILRQTIDVASMACESAFASEHNAHEVLDEAIASLMALQKLDTNCEYTLRGALKLALDAAHKAGELKGEIPGIKTGLSRLDRVLGGWHESDLVVIGARPAIGKTALLLNFALAADVPCGIISAEQPVQQVGARLMAIDSHVPAEKFRSGQFEAGDLIRLDSSAHRLLPRTCMIYDRSSPTIAEVSRIARKWKQQSGIKALFVDYVQRIEASGASGKTPRHERVGEVVRGLKNLARDLGIPVISLAQVGRQVESREDKRPGMGDLSDSSEIEKEADQILMLYRDDAYNEDSPDKGTAEIDVVKNRHGPNGLVKCAWLAETMRFVDLAHEQRAA